MNESNHPEPENGVLTIEDISGSVTIPLGFVLGGATAWLAPQLLSGPKVPAWARESYVGWGIGLLVLLFILGLDYHDKIVFSECRRSKGLHFYGIGIFASSTFLTVPYHLNWEWKTRTERGRRSNVRVQKLELTCYELGAYHMAQFGENDTPPLETLNRIGEELAAWNHGKIFSYTSFKDVPE